MHIAHTDVIVINYTTTIYKTFTHQFECFQDENS